MSDRAGLCWLALAEMKQTEKGFVYFIDMKPEADIPRSFCYRFLHKLQRNAAQEPVVAMSCLLGISGPVLV